VADLSLDKVTLEEALSGNYLAKPGVAPPWTTFDRR
jgi:hypothetical protein